MTSSLLLTFDYEVFLGSRSGTVQRCLLDPTDAILKVLEKHQVKGIFFVDTLYLSSLEKETSAVCRAESKQIMDQLDTIKKAGHTIGIHIHPHWLDAKYDAAENNWNGENKRRFALSNLDEEEKRLVIKDSVRILDRFMDPGKYRSYRAGGFYCQPFSGFSHLFAEENILLDFSLMREFKSRGFEDWYSFDFSLPPKDFIYRFEVDPLKPSLEGRFIEVSVNSFRLEGLIKLRNSIYYRLNRNNPDYRMMGNGKGSGNIIAHKSDAGIMSKLRNNTSFSIELMNPVLADGYRKALMKEKYLHFVSHPKLFTPGGISSFDLFLSYIAAEEVENDYRNVIKTHLRENLPNL